MHGVHKYLGLESRAFLEVLEEPQLPSCGARQQPRRVAVQEWTQECVTAVMNEGTAPLVEVPEEPQLPRARGARQAAIQERTQECMTAVMNEGSAPC